MISDAQKVALSNDIRDAEAPQVVKAALASGNHGALGRLYSAIASPQTVVWRTDITTQEIKNVVDWPEYIARLPGERGAFMLLIADGVVDAGKANVRKGFTDIFGAQEAPATREALTALAKRDSTVIEKLFMTGAGTNANPGTLIHEGGVSSDDVRDALSATEV